MAVPPDSSLNGRHHGDGRSSGVCRGRAYGNSCSPDRDVGTADGDSEPEPEEAMTDDGMMMKEPAPLIDPDSVSREKTFIVMSGGQDGRFRDWENFNNYVPGGVGGGTPDRYRQLASR